MNNKAAAPRTGRRFRYAVEKPYQILPDAAAEPPASSPPISIRIGPAEIVYFTEAAPPATDALFLLAITMAKMKTRIAATTVRQPMRATTVFSPLTPRNFATAKQTVTMK